MNNIVLERLKQNVAAEDGCSAIYLKVLKSDLSRLLKQYMDIAGIEFDILDEGETHKFSIIVTVNQFLEIGRGQ